MSKTTAATVSSPARSAVRWVTDGRGVSYSDRLAVGIAVSEGGTGPERDRAEADQYSCRPAQDRTVGHRTKGKKKKKKKKKKKTKLVKEVAVKTGERARRRQSHRDRPC